MANKPKPAQRRMPRNRPPSAAAQSGRPVADVDHAIQGALQGSVNVTPAKAIEMAGRLFAQGKYDQAEKVCRQLIMARPTNADAHNILGVTLNALGRHDEAIASLRQAIALAPAASSVHANLGEVLRQRGKTEEAAEVLEKAVELDPQNAQALNNLGITYFERRQPKRAIEFYRRAVEASPQLAEAHNNLGNAFRVVGDVESAIQAYQDALVQRERYPEAYNNLGTLLQQKGQIDEAEHAFRKAINQNPAYAEAYDNLANIYIAQKKDTEALRVLGDALKIAPAHVPTLIITARTQLRRGAYPLCEQAMRVALRHEPENAEVLTVLGQVLHETDRYDEALEVLEQALKASPDSPEALNFYGVALKSTGRLDEARDYLLKALRGNRRMFGAYANLNDLVDFSKGEGHELYEEMDRIFQSAKNPESDPFLALHFAYAKALDDRGEHERALHHYIVGGKLKRAQLDYKEEETFGFFDKIREAFPKEKFENRAFAGLDDDRPVFIVGMPRSGSTLVEQILSSHPDVYGAGEVKYLSIALGKLRDRFPSLPRYPHMMDKITPAQMDIAAKTYIQALTASSGGAKRATDKLLTNYFFVGLLNLF